jgi:hypothetical protein
MNNQSGNHERRLDQELDALLLPIVANFPLLCTWSNLATVS